MAAIVLLFFYLTAKFSISNAQNNSTQISLGSSLSPATNKSFWLSNSGQFAFGFYQQDNGGFSVGIWVEKVKQKTVVWTANRDGPSLPLDTTLLLNGDGRLVLLLNGVETSLANTSQPAASASMLDSGNFVLYGSNSAILWQSFDYPTDTLLPGQHLFGELGLISSISETNHASGRFKLLMQSDGNLVQYPIGNGVTGHNAYWNTATQFKGERITLNLDPNGQLYLRNSTGFNILNISDNVVADKSQPSKNVMYRFTIDFDGILRLYNRSLVQNSDWTVVWVSTRNRCDPTGLCGLNSYCSLIDDEPHCLCLPGFDFTDLNQKSLGCGRNSSVDFCVVGKDDTAVSLREVDGVMWDENSYSVLSSISKADCEKNCLSDCNCEIALYFDQLCNKQMFPLRLSKVAKDGPVTTIVKVHNGVSATTNQTIIGSQEKIKNGKRKDILIVGIICTTFTFSILLFCVFLVCRRHSWLNKKVRMSSNEGTSMIDDELFNMRSFTYNELDVATNGFVEKLGRGAFGTVYKGTLPNAQRVVAVKRLEKVAGEGEVEFQNEVRSIGRTHHRNLLRLLGYCNEGSNRLLVYDYMINGSLSKFLFKSQVKPNWDERVSIALGIARGILYLHEECENQIIHCDINPNNILIDENHSAKIADFGLAKLLMPDQTRTVTGIRGTRGFISPEWHKNMPITAKADVYSYGVVLLVIICCRRSVDINVPEREAILVDWVYECFKGNQVKNLVPDEEVDEQEFERMVRIALWCIQDEPSTRPTMKKVVAMFEGTIDIQVPPNLTSYSSTSTENIFP